MYKKVYIEVNIKVTSEGVVRPLSIVWEDGAIYEITRVKFVTPAASLKVGGRGNRYTVIIEGKERYLFEDDRRWFVEAICQN